MRDSYFTGVKHESPHTLGWRSGDSSMCSFISRDLHTYIYTNENIFAWTGDSILFHNWHFILSFNILIYTWGWTFSSECLLAIHFFFGELLLHNLCLLFYWAVFFLVPINVYSHIVNTHLLLSMWHRPIFQHVHLPFPNNIVLGKPLNPGLFPYLDNEDTACVRLWGEVRTSCQVLSIMPGIQEVLNKC